MSKGASEVAVHPAVRRTLLDLQHSFRKAPGLVADGRDMGTVVFPDATLKIFLTASAEVRAERRYKQLMAKEIRANLLDILQDLQKRDTRDQQRLVAPLQQSADAKLLETSQLTIEQSVERVLEMAQAVQGDKHNNSSE
jgi:cytidylate kinase